MTSTDSQSFSLPTNMDLDAIDGIRDWLMAALEIGPVTLDGGQVERVYTNCLLMLVSAASEAVSHGQKLVVSNASPALIEAITTLGLASHFSDILEG